MIFGQPTNRDSLRDLFVVIDDHSLNIYHLGFGKSLTRSNFAKSNENRNNKIFEEFVSCIVIIQLKYYELQLYKLLKGSSNNIVIYKFKPANLNEKISGFLYYWEN